MGLSPAKLFPLQKRTESTAIARDQQVTILALTLCVTLEKLSGVPPPSSVCLVFRQQQSWIRA